MTISGEHESVQEACEDSWCAGFGVHPAGNGCPLAEWPAVKPSWRQELKLELRIRVARFLRDLADRIWI
jgi:hypothetical protein